MKIGPNGPIFFTDNHKKDRLSIFLINTHSVWELIAMLCYNCEKEIGDKELKHIYFCDKTSISKQDKKFKFLKFNQQIIDKAELLHDYEVSLLSIPEISKKYNICYSRVVFLLDYHVIPKRNIKESINSGNVITKRKATCIDKYGVDNPSKSNEIKAKKTATLLEHYGVTHMSQIPGMNDYIKELMFARYGKRSLPNLYGNMNEWWNRQTDDFKKAHVKPANDAYMLMWQDLSDDAKYEIIQRRNFNGSSVGTGKSKLEDRLSNVLTSLMVSHIRQKWIKNRSYDFHIMGTRMIIEVQGDFWHANPKSYKESDILNHFGNKITAGEIWLKDADKKKLAENYGYEVFYIWESDMNIWTDAELAEYVINLINGLKTD